MTANTRTRNKAACAGAVLAPGIVLALALTAVPPVGSQTPASPAAARISRLDLERLRNFKAFTPTTVPDHLSLASSGEAVYVPLQIEFKDAAARLRFRPPEGVTVFFEFDRFADAFLDVRLKESCDDLQAMDGVVWIDVGTEVLRVPPPPRPIVTSEKARAAEKVVRGGFDGLTGKGVVVAVIDDGIDFRHKDFITLDKDGRPVSRVLYYWDTYANPTPGGPGTPAPLSYPNGTPIGVVYSREDLTAELRSSTNKIPIEGWHGTACAGVAAGNGNMRSDKKYVGVAPDADIIAVRIGRMGPWNQYLLGAICAWIDEKAGARPAVISCSFGHPQVGGRDGCRVTERQLDALFHGGRKGRAICVAAGNEARFGLSQRYHAAVAFGGEEAKGVLSWDSPFGTAGRLTLYVDTDAPDDVAVKLGVEPQPAVFRYVHPLSRSLVIELELKGTAPPPGASHRTSQVEIWSKGRRKLHADAYIDTDRWFAGSFRGNGGSKVGLLRTPGTMNNAITVGSYDFNAIDDRTGTPVVLSDMGMPLRLGDISAYSSPGYSRLGVVKPSFAAPGQYFVAPSSRFMGTGEYNPFNGTSAATPYTAGVLALLMQKRPAITFGEIKTLLTTHATRDAITGRTPNPQWGHGRLDYRAVRAVFNAVPAADSSPPTSR